MNDWKTRDIVSYVLDEMGYKLLSKYAKEDDSQIDSLVNLVKILSPKYKSICEMVDFFL